jgi:hypothetical protein
MQMRDDSRLMRAMVWLQETLADGAVPAAETAEEAARAGHSAWVGDGVQETEDRKTDELSVFWPLPPEPHPHSNPPLEG